MNSKIVSVIPSFEVMMKIAKRMHYDRWFHAIIALVFALLPLQSIAQKPGALPLTFTEMVPLDLLATRSVIIHDHVIQQKELQEMQVAFQQIGIDAVAYFEKDIVLAGKDVTKAFATYFTNRQVKYLIFFDKTADGTQLVATTFDPQYGLFDAAKPAWRVKKARLNELLLTVFQDSWRSQKKQNFLVNEFPETDIALDPIKGNRQEFYAIDLKVDNLAVPKFGNEAMDQELEKFFKENYPLKYKITEADADEQQLRSQGFLYVLCYVHTRGDAAKEVLGYDLTKSESAYASITFPSGQLQLKTIPAETPVYKFYFRHIDNGNVFLGTKWDADVTWQEALRNHVLGFKTEARIN